MIFLRGLHIVKNLMRLFLNIYITEDMRLVTDKLISKAYLIANSFNIKIQERAIVLNIYT